MAASGFTPISLYYSTTAAAEPTAGNLVSGELAINIADGKLFYKNSSGNVRLLSIGYGSSTVTPTNGGVQYGTGSALALTAAGSSGQILRSNGAAAPTWVDLSSLGVNTISFGSTGLTPSTATSGAVTVAGTLITSNGGTGLSSYTAGDMVYYSTGTTLTKLTIGAANRVMTSSGSAPQWVDSLTGLSSVSSTAFTENSYPVVSQSDIGTAPNEIPLNQYLGSMAYQDADNYLAVPQATGWGFKNRIINGAMVIDQRNAGASITPSVNGTMSLDRWKCGLNTGLAASKYSVQQSSTAPAGFSNSVLITSTSAYTVQADDYSTFSQAIEGFNFADFAFGTANAKSLTISFQIRCSLTGTFAGWIQNDAVNRSFPFTFTINSANTWESKSITIPGDTTGTWVGATNGTGLILGFNLGVGSNRIGTANAWGAGNYRSVTGAVNLIATNGATMYITGVQLEVGTQATAFDWRPYGTELMLCQRYYFKITPGNGVPFGMAFGRTTSASRISIPFPVTMRSAPTALEQSGTAADYNNLGLGAAGADITCSSVPTFNAASVQHASVTNTFSSTVVVAAAGFGSTASATAFYAWSAEL